MMDAEGIRDNPWPDEINNKITDKLQDLLQYNATKLVKRFQEVH